MLIDDITLIIKAGNGGDGSISLRRNAQTAKGGPDGGNGGNGGSVYFQGSTNISDLSQFQFKKKILAQDGVPGKKNNLFGKNGEDLLVLVPVGTAVVTIENNEIVEITNTRDRVLIAKGGKGGRGNNEFKSATNQTPIYAEPGEKGEEKKVRLELRLIADVGFVGLPNTGKSSLLEVLTNAKPKIGDYPFTTLEPNLGIAQGIILADIPGVIKGASVGKGLGLRFLKHIEKTNFLVFCIDAMDMNPFETYEMLQNECRAYKSTLLQKPKIILLTKVDLISEKVLKETKKIFMEQKEEILPVSIYQEKTIANLRKLLLEKGRQ